MAYVKTTWNTGDVITAEKLNNAENQIERLTPAVISETITGTTSTLTSTWQEIKDMFDAGQVMVLYSAPTYIGIVSSEESSYYVGIYSPRIYNGHLEQIKYYVTDSASGYPAYDA